MYPLVITYVGSAQRAAMTNQLQDNMIKIKICQVMSSNGQERFLWRVYTRVLFINYKVYKALVLTGAAFSTSSATYLSL